VHAQFNEINKRRTAERTNSLNVLSTDWRDRNIDRFSDEGCLVVRHDEANDDLEREPGVADALDVEEGRVSLLPLFFQAPRRRPCCRGGLVGCGVVNVQRDVAQYRHSHAVVCLETERQDRRDYKEHRYTGDYLQHSDATRDTIR